MSQFNCTLSTQTTATFGQQINNARHNCCLGWRRQKTRVKYQFIYTFFKQINTMPGMLAAVSRSKLSTTEKGGGRKKAGKSQVNKTCPGWEAKTGVTGERWDKREGSQVWLQ
jgi:hypothetical protein